MSTGIVSKIVYSVPDTLRKMDVGEVINCNAAETVMYNNARIAVSRANKNGNYGRFEISTPDNGCTFTIKRIS